MSSTVSNLPAATAVSLSDLFYVDQANGTVNSKATVQQIFGAGVNDNALFGPGAGASITTGSTNTAFGSQALAAATTATGCVAVGYQSQVTATGAQNVSVGAFAMQGPVTGSQNTAVGHGALGNGATTSAASNAALGTQSLQSITTGSTSVGVGVQAGTGLTTGNNCTALGRLTTLAAAASFRTVIGSSAADAGVDNSVSVGRVGQDAFYTQGLRVLSLGALAAAGGNQGGAAVIAGPGAAAAREVVNINAGTGGAILPTPPAAGSLLFRIINTSGNPVNLYPAVGGQINALGNNNPLSVSDQTIADVFSVSATQWYSK